MLAETLHRRLVRLQCYEGLDVSSAVYEWNYARQMLEIRMAEAEGATDREGLAQDIFTERFLIHRPLLQALQPHEGAGPPVLLIDELDRTDEPFEAYLLEVLADFQITIPEIGTIKADAAADRDHHLEPHARDPRRAQAPLLLPLGRLSERRARARDHPRAPAGAPERLSQQIVGFVQKLRAEDLFKLPGVAETLDWTQALMTLDRLELDPQTINDTLGTLLKYQDDIAKIQGSEAARLLAEVKRELAAAG